MLSNAKDLLPACGGNPCKRLFQTLPQFAKRTSRADFHLIPV